MIDRVAVLGAGLMGHAIAEALAAGGVAVRLHDVSAERLDAARRAIDADLALLVEEGAMAPGDAARTVGSIEPAPALEAAVAGAGLVLETIVESLPEKRALYARVEALVPEATPIASNTSTLALSALAAGARRPERFLLAHFFNPAHLVPLVEVLAHPAAPPGLVDGVLALLRRAGRRPILVRKEVPGLVANRLQAALAREALALLEAGVADAADLDAAVTEGPGMRWPFLGPLAVADHGGLAVWERVLGNLAPVLDASREAPAALRAAVARGDLGVATGRGLRAWPTGAAGRLARERDRALLRLARLKGSAT